MQIGRECALRLARRSLAQLGAELGGWHEISAPPPPPPQALGVSDLPGCLR